MGSWLKLTTQFSCVSVFCVFLLIAKSTGFTSATAHSPQAGQPTPPCASSEYRQFDFWVGDWDVFEGSSPSPVARAHVDRILDGCVIREDYQSTDGLKGESFSIYDASRKVWHQTWVTNRGQLLIIEGNLEDRAMVLAGIDRASSGEERYVRGTWKQVEGGVRESAVRSIDGGKAWKPWFDLMFRPHK